MTDKDSVNLFETPKAKLAAMIMWLGAFGTFGASGLYHATNTQERAMILGFYASLLTIPHVWVHRTPHDPANVLGFISSIAILLAFPRTRVCRSHSYLGAMHGASGVFISLRALQFYMNQQEFNGWQPWRRMYFISAWFVSCGPCCKQLLTIASEHRGWHDFRKAKFVNEAQLRHSMLVAELRELAKCLLLLLGGGIALKLWGKPGGQVRPNSAVVFFFLVRWTIGFFTLLAWFNVMDKFPRALHLWADGHELMHISQDAWNARTLKEFWRRWDIPVQEMLEQGVYLPITRRTTWLGPRRKTLAKLIVFLLSALGHTYAISCGGLPKRHLQSMFGFFAMQVPLLGVEHFAKLGGVPWMILAELPVAPLFIEPCLTFVDL